MKQICEHSDNAGLTISYEDFEHIFYVEQFSGNCRKMSGIHRTNK